MSCYLGAICFSSGGPIKLWLALSADENRRLFCNLFDAASGLKLPLSEKKTVELSPSPFLIVFFDARDSNRSDNLVMILSLSDLERSTIG